MQLLLSQLIPGGIVGLGQGDEAVERLPQVIREGRDRLPFPIACSLNRAVGAGTHFDRYVVLLQAGEAILQMLGVQALLEVAARGRGVGILRGRSGARTGIGLWQNALDIVAKGKKRPIHFKALVETLRREVVWQDLDRSLDEIARLRHRFAHPISRMSEPSAAGHEQLLIPALERAVAHVEWLAHGAMLHVLENLHSSGSSSVRLLMGHNLNNPPIVLPGDLPKGRLLWLDPTMEPAPWIALEPVFRWKDNSVYAYSRTEDGRAEFLRVDEPERDPWFEDVPDEGWLAARFERPDMLTHGTISLDDDLRARLVSHDQVDDWGGAGRTSGNFGSLPPAEAPPRTAVDIRTIDAEDVAPVMAREEPTLGDPLPLPEVGVATPPALEAPLQLAAPEPRRVSRGALWGGLVLGAALVLGLGFWTAAPEGALPGLGPSDCTTWAECGLAKGCIDRQCQAVKPMEFRRAWIDYQKSRQHYAAGDLKYFEVYSDPIECWYGDRNGRPRAHLEAKRRDFLGGDIQDEVLNVQVRHALPDLVVFEESHRIVGKKGPGRTFERVIGMRPTPGGWRVIAETERDKACDKWLDGEAARGR